MLNRFNSTPLSDNWLYEYYKHCTIVDDIMVQLSLNGNNEQDDNIT